MVITVTCSFLDMVFYSEDVFVQISFILQQMYHNINGTGSRHTMVCHAAKYGPVTDEFVFYRSKENAVFMHL